LNVDLSWRTRLLACCTNFVSNFFAEFKVASLSIRKRLPFLNLPLLSGEVDVSLRASGEGASIERNLAAHAPRKFSVRIIFALPVLNIDKQSTATV
jgi:hypothetical protein